MLMTQQRLVSGHQGYQGAYQPVVPLDHHQVYDSRSDVVQSPRHHDYNSSTATMFGRSQHAVSPFHGVPQDIRYAPTTSQYPHPDESAYKHALLRHQLSMEALSDVTTKSRPRMTTRVWWRHCCHGDFLNWVAGQFMESNKNHKLLFWTF